MERLKQKVSTIKSLIPEGARICYVDFPIYNNFGDILIMLGTEAFLRYHGINIDRSFAVYAPQKIYSDESNGFVWLLNGGGNFGDLWSLHQQFREAIIAQHPQTRVIGLPQSLYYSSMKLMDKFARTAEKHADLHLCWRDDRSFQIASEKFQCHNYLIPDMAHFLWPLRPSGRRVVAKYEDLFLIRQDKEATDLPRWVMANRACFIDWRDLIPFPLRQMRRLISAMDRTAGATDTDIPSLSIWLWFTKRLLIRMTEVFESYDRVISSRLHAHLFACLVGRHSILLDNIYYKNSSYFHTWTSLSQLGQFEENWS
jgi:pyruvyl transferase EpsO